MTDRWLDDLRPVSRHAGAPAAQAAHAYLRARVLDGSIPPGAVMNQVDISQSLGMSRTPVREAIRMLQEEGLVDAEPWKRARVVSFDAAHLEAVYVQRIMLECLGVALTAPLMTAKDLAALAAMADELARKSGESDRSEAWNALHKRFHLALIAGVSAHLQRSMEISMERAEQYRALYHYRGPLPSFQHVGEHERIVELCGQRAAAEAAYELAAHLARTALSLIGQMAPRYDPAAIRISLGCFQTGAAPALLPTPGQARVPRAATRGAAAGA